MPTRRTLELVAAALVTMVVVAIVARVPAVLGETLGEPVARTGAAAMAAIVAQIAASPVPDRGRREAIRLSPAAAFWGVALTLAAFGVLDLGVPRRRGVLLAVTAAATHETVRAWLGQRQSLRPTFAVLVLGILGLTGLGLADRAPLRTSLPPIESAAAPVDAPNVVVITLETTRVDALGCYGQEGPVTPRIDGVAADAAVFTSATAEAPHTHPTIGALLTGRYPVEHGSISGSPRIAYDVTTLAEHLRAHGYATAGFLDNPWLGLEFGLARGYEHLERRVRLARVQSWLSRVGDAPYLLHLHLFHPHGPYELREDELEAIGGSDAPDAARARVGDRVEANTIRAGEVPGRHGFDADELTWIRDMYLSEVRAMDATVGEVLDMIDESKTIVVIAADHGEEFDERGSLHHSHTLFEELVHVPLILRAPGHGAARIDDPVGLVDVAPTLLDLAGLPPLPHAAGRSLRPLLEGETLGERLTVTQRFQHAGRRTLLAARLGRWKLHLRADEGTSPVESPLDIALFDLDADPNERDDLAAEEPKVVERIVAALGEWESAAADRVRASEDAYSGPAEPESEALSPAARAELRGLGYGGGER